MAIKMHAYKNGSESAKALRDALGIKMLLPAGKGKWKGKAGDVVINWGSSTAHPNIGLATYVNTPEAVAKAANKLTTQREFDKTPEMRQYMLPWTTDQAVVQQWMEENIGNGNPQLVVARTKLTGNSGEGIVLCNREEQNFVQAPLYTKYMQKKDEYRIHVFDGEIIDVQRKARKRDVEDDKVNWKVRNLDGGFIFARNEVVAPLVVRQAALEAIKALGLVHGAVDIGHGRHGTYVYEVNTACGLAGSTLVTYTKAYAKYLGMDEKDLKLTKEQLDDYVPMAAANLGGALEDEAIQRVAEALEEHIEMPLVAEGVLAVVADEAHNILGNPLGFNAGNVQNVNLQHVNLGAVDAELQFGNLKVIITKENFAKVARELM
ncbi:amino acid ligase [Vibrio phage Phriendly]|nr:amino acid ligase [Vibrio phage Phriendly]